MGASPSKQQEEAEVPEAIKGAHGSELTCSELSGDQGMDQEEPLACTSPANSSCGALSWLCRTSSGVASSWREGSSFYTSQDWTPEGAATDATGRECVLGLHSDAAGRAGAMCEGVGAGAGWPHTLRVHAHSTFPACSADSPHVPASQKVQLCSEDSMALCCQPMCTTHNMVWPPPAAEQRHAEGGNVSAPAEARAAGVHDTVLAQPQPLHNLVMCCNRNEDTAAAEAQGMAPTPKQASTVQRAKGSAPPTDMPATNQWAELVQPADAATLCTPVTGAGSHVSVATGATAVNTCPLPDLALAATEAATPRHQHATGSFDYQGNIAATSLEPGTSQLGAAATVQAVAGSVDTDAPSLPTQLPVRCMTPASATGEAGVGLTIELTEKGGARALHVLPQPTPTTPTTSSVTERCLAHNCASPPPAAVRKDVRSRHSLDAHLPTLPTSVHLKPAVSSRTGKQSSGSSQHAAYVSKRAARKEALKAKRGKHVFSIQSVHDFPALPSPAAPSQCSMPPPQTAASPHPQLQDLEPALDGRLGGDRARMGLHVLVVSRGAGHAPQAACDPTQSSLREEGHVRPEAVTTTTTFQEGGAGACVPVGQRADSPGGTAAAAMSQDPQLDEAAVPTFATNAWLRHMQGALLQAPCQPHVAAAPPSVGPAAEHSPALSPLRSCVSTDAVAFNPAGTSDVHPMLAMWQAQLAQLHEEAERLDSGSRGVQHPSMRELSCSIIPSVLSAAVEDVEVELDAAAASAIAAATLVVGHSSDVGGDAREQSALKTGDRSGSGMAGRAVVVGSGGEGPTGAMPHATSAASSACAISAGTEHASSSHMLSQLFLQGAHTEGAWAGTGISHIHAPAINSRLAMTGGVRWARDAESAEADMLQPDGSKGMRLLNSPGNGKHDASALRTCTQPHSSPRTPAASLLCASSMHTVQGALGNMHHADARAACTLTQVQPMPYPPPPPPPPPPRFHAKHPHQPPAASPGGSGGSSGTGSSGRAGTIRQGAGPREVAYPAAAGRVDHAPPRTPTAGHAPRTPDIRWPSWVAMGPGSGTHGVPAASAGHMAGGVNSAQGGGGNGRPGTTAVVWSPSAGSVLPADLHTGGRGLMGSRARDTGFPAFPAYNFSPGYGPHAHAAAVTASGPQPLHHTLMEQHLAACSGPPITCASPIQMYNGPTGTPASYSSTCYSQPCTPCYGGQWGSWYDGGGEGPMYHEGLTWWEAPMEFQAPGRGVQSPLVNNMGHGTYSAASAIHNSRHGSSRGHAHHHNHSQHRGSASQGQHQKRTQDPGMARVLAISPPTTPGPQAMRTGTAVAVRAPPPAQVVPVRAGQAPQPPGHSPQSPTPAAVFSKVLGMVLCEEGLDA